MPAAGTPLPWDRGNGPCVMAPPHLRGWAEEAAAFLSRRGMDGITAFATSGSSGSPPKAILFTRRALDICARGALEHLHAESGDWCCPLPLWHVGGAMIYLRAALAGTAVHRQLGEVPDRSVFHLPGRICRCVGRNVLAISRNGKNKGNKQKTGSHGSTLF